MRIETKHKTNKYFNRLLDRAVWIKDDYEIINLIQEILELDSVEFWSFINNQIINSLIRYANGVPGIGEGIRRARTLLTLIKAGKCPRMEDRVFKRKHPIKYIRVVIKRRRLKRALENLRMRHKKKINGFSPNGNSHVRKTRNITELRK